MFPDDFYAEMLEAMPLPEDCRAMSGKSKAGSSRPDRKPTRAKMLGREFPQLQLRSVKLNESRAGAIGERMSQLQKEIGHDLSAELLEANALDMELYGAGHSPARANFTLRESIVLAAARRTRFAR